MGEPDVDGMLEKMSSRLLTEWMVYYGLEPWGVEADAMIGGGISSVIAEIHRDKKKRSNPHSPRDFALQFDEREYEDEVAEKEKERDEVMGKAVLAWAMGMGVEVVDLRDEA